MDARNCTQGLTRAMDLKLQEEKRKHRRARSLSHGPRGNYRPLEPKSEFPELRGDLGCPLHLCQNVVPPKEPKELIPSALWVPPTGAAGERPG